MPAKIGLADLVPPPSIDPAAPMIARTDRIVIDPPAREPFPGLPRSVGALAAEGRIPRPRLCGADARDAQGHEDRRGAGALGVAARPRTLARPAAQTSGAKRFSILPRLSMSQRTT